jgi:PAS domain S-box-containing protein
MKHEGENTVLVVNDTPDQLELMSILLNTAGYKVFTASDGREGFEVAQRERPDLLISDVLMPRATGIELCQWIRADVELRETPIMLVSALRKDTASAVEGLKAGADVYFEAPYDSMRLIALMARLVERKHSNDALRESENNYRMLIDQASDGIFIFDRHGAFKVVNTKACQMLGYREKELLGLNLKGLIFTADLTLSPIRFDELEKGESVLSEGGLRHHDGSLIPVEISAKMLADGSIQAIIRDITERKRAEEERERLQAALRRSETMSAMGSLIAGVAHEVRNPLFGISSILDAFEARFGDRQDYQRYITILRGEVYRLNDLMHELLEYATPTSRELVASSIEDCIAQAIRSCASLAERLKVRIVNNIKKEFAPVLMDQRRLPQVFSNLLENALHHSPYGGTITVEANAVNVEDGQKWIECSIKDGGPGIKSDDLARIFEPFFTRRRGGIGLGLSIVQRIVDEHGGKVSANNLPEGGASVTVRLPLMAARAASNQP